jgi:hypothetical protein
MKEQADLERRSHEDALRAQLEAQVRAHAEAAAGRSAAEARALELEKALEEAKKAATHRAQTAAPIEPQRAPKNSDAAAAANERRNSTAQPLREVKVAAPYTGGPQLQAHFEQISTSLTAALSEARTKRDKTLEDALTNLQKPDVKRK